MPDISSIDDIRLLVDSFYNKVRANDVIGPFFTSIAQVNWTTHLPKMYLFWNAVLFDAGGFQGNPIVTHVELNKKKPIESLHFDTWIKLFEETVDALFSGTIADKAKSKATLMLSLIQMKIEQSQEKGFIQ